MEATTQEKTRPVENRLNRETLQQAMNLLSVDQRQVVVLRFVARMSSAEIAPVLKTSPMAVKDLLHGALITLWGVLDDWDVQYAGDHTHPLEAVLDGFPAEAQDSEAFMRLASAMSDILHPRPLSPQARGPRRVTAEKAQPRQTAPRKVEPKSALFTLALFTLPTTSLSMAGALALLILLIVISMGFWLL